MNPFGIHEPCNKVAESEVLSEQYIMDPNCDKYDIEILNDDAIKRNKILFYFMQRTFNLLDAFYLREIFLLIDTIIKYQMMKQSAAEI